MPLDDETRAVILGLDDGFAVIRRTYELESKTISHADICELLGLEDTQDEEAERRSEGGEPFVERRSRLIKKWNDIRSEVKLRATTGGHGTPAVPNIEVVQALIPELLDDLADGRISYKQAIRRIEEHRDALLANGLRRLPVERTLRRWIGPIKRKADISS